MQVTSEINARHDRLRSFGFTLVELLIVIALISILAAIATPPALQWREQLQYRQVAKEIVATMRDGRGMAISRNRQFRVFFDPPNRQYRLEMGDRSAESVNWVPAPTRMNWVVLPANVNLNVPAAVLATPITFNPNGSAVSVNPSTVSISSTIVTGTYNIDVFRSGRIRTRR